MSHTTNPFAQPSTLPYGLTDFAHIRPEHYREAFEEAMPAALAELDAIAANPEPPTVENTLDAWDASGQYLSRALTSFFVVKAADTTDELDALEEEYAPKLASFSDAIYLNRALYARLRALEARAQAGEVELDAEASWLLEDRLKEFVRSGIELDAEQQEQLKALNQRLAELSTRFDKAHLAARNAASVFVQDAAELDGLDADEIAAMKQDDGTYKIELVNTTQQPILEQLTNRDVRRRVFEASTHRGLTPEADTRDIIVEIARARAERANLLGYPHHAALVAESGCAKTTENVADILGRLVPAALAQAKADADDLRARFAELYPGETFEAWDWQYVAEKVRAERYALDPEELKPYLGVQKVLDEVYAAATRLYGITFVKRDDLRGHTEDADVYEVFDASGEAIGLFVMDFWARPTKQGGAWMNNIVEQSTLLGTKPVVTNNCNYTRTQQTVSWDGVITMFHEFGHALHGLFAHTRYVSMSGTNVPRDFVEFPSQVNEHWAWEPDAVLPAELSAKIERADKFNQGYANYEAWVAMLLDQAWHTTPLAELPTRGDELEEFERRALEKAGVAYDLIPPRYRSSYFAHIWGVGYAAAYYSYVWSEVMDADAVEWFNENGGCTRENGDAFRAKLLAPGGSVDVMETWRNFRGREPEIGPLLKRAGIEA